MQIFVNGDPMEIDAGLSLAAVVKLLSLHDTACATAVNQQFVPRQQREKTILKANDHIMTFEPITGG